MKQPSACWSTITLEQVVRAVRPGVEVHKGLSLPAKLVFAALAQRNWDGCLVRQEIIATTRFNTSTFDFHFLRWKGRSINLMGETLDQALENLRSRRDEARPGLEEVLTAPNLDVSQIAGSLPEDMERIGALLDRLILDSTTVSALSPSIVHRL